MDNQYFSTYKTQPIELQEKITSRLNVYNVAKVVYDCMVQAWYDEDVERLEQDMLKMSEKIYKKRGKHFLTSGYSTHRKPDYSERLRDLLRRCLHIRPSDRPTELELEQEYPAGLQGHTKLLTNTTSEGALSECDTRKLFFKNNAINKMPLGDGKFKIKEFPLLLPHQVRRPQLSTRTTREELQEVPAEAEEAEICYGEEHPNGP